MQIEKKTCSVNSSNHQLKLFLLGTDFSKVWSVGETKPIEQTPEMNYNEAGSENESLYDCFAAKVMKVYALQLKHTQSHCNGLIILS